MSEWDLCYGGVLNVMPLLGPSRSETTLGGSIYYVAFLMCLPLSKGARHVVAGESKTVPFYGDRPSPTIYLTSPLSIKCG
jgi:hypothetical protein